MTRPEPAMSDAIPHHQLQPGDVLRWQCPKFPHVVHRWEVFGVYLGAIGQESLIEVECLSHGDGWTGEGCDHRRLFIPEVLTRQCTIEDIGDHFGLPSVRSRP